MESNKDEGAIDVLSSIIDECVSNPAKQQQFVDEGCIELLLELCRSQNLQVKSYAAGALVMLCHQNNTAKAKVIAQGGATTLVLICQPHERKSSNLGDPTNNERLLSHMQGAAVVQKLAYKNAACQRELISAGAVRQLVALCDVFDADGSHGNCCQMIYKHSDEADKAMYEMTKGRQLIGSVKELGKSQAVRAALHLLHKGLDFTVLSELFNKFNSVDLYDTSMPGKNVIIAKELVEKGLVWPDLSREDPPCERSRGKNDKSKGENTWRDISICEVIDAGHFWAHVGGESTKLRIEEIRKFLHSQICDPLQGIPEPGDIVGVSGNIAGHKDHYRAIILDVSSATDAQDGQAKVFAIDYGFTVLVKTSSLFTLPKELQECLPQVSLCTLAGVQPCPTHAAILEHTAGALQNLSYELANVGFITTAGGIEVLLKVLTVRNFLDSSPRGSC
ncbi:uncharacterized protein LOC5514712 [Nematostella vectensis]|uniref:uncharacterized protein LOC5514712 n=1 Tax=Nematostella vectensis TaxID=45351 RepID=UPI00207773C2|nr:uncharacterized protein LOC5514712 [Nematostella vectensis]